MESSLQKSLSLNGMIVYRLLAPLMAIGGLAWKPHNFQSRRNFTGGGFTGGDCISLL